MSLSEINIKTAEGRLLIAAIEKLSETGTEAQEVLNMLWELSDLENKPATERRCSHSLATTMDGGIACICCGASGKDTIDSIIDEKQKAVGNLPPVTLTLKPEREKNIWGADIEENNKFFKAITKNAGQRD